MENKSKIKKNKDQNLDFFKFDLKSDKQQMETFENIYNSKDGNWSKILSELEEDKRFESETINNLNFTYRLSQWSNNNQEIVAAFQNDKNIQSMRDIAITLDKAAFIAKVKDFAPSIKEDEKQTFAIRLHRELFKLEPTAILVRMIKDPNVSILNDAIGNRVATILEKQPDFNIKTTSVYELVLNEEVVKDLSLDQRQEVITQLKTLQRIAALSPDSDAVPILYNANLLSAMHISTIPQAQFMSMMSKTGLDDGTLMQIHSHAQQARVRNEQAIMALSESYRGTGVAMIDRSLNIGESTAFKDAAAPNQSDSSSSLEKTLNKHNLSWDLLFGDADFCECEECTSIYSPAAYYVELLQYIRNNNLDPNLDLSSPLAIRPNPKDITGTPLEKLFDRRPDLGCLELTCKNTNTVMPYIDLVNEIMENYVAFKQLKPFNVEDETSGELLAEPQHIEYQAYCILKNEVYPFTLPYHQPIDANRIYLNHLDTSRYELIDTFRKKSSDPDVEVVALKREALDRAADAEFLGLTMEEYVILTKECFETKSLMDKLKKKIHTDDEYRQTIGVKPVCKYYGFDDNATMLGGDGLTLIKQQFLRRTGIDYFNLVDLLKTEFINPLLPKGKDKTIMEELHFSYRFLQNYAKAIGIDKMAEQLVKGEKLLALAPKLKEQLDGLKKGYGLCCPDSNEMEISDKDIVHWVKCRFEKVGKMIVIENGRNCVNGKIFRSVRSISYIQNCKMYYDNGDQIIDIGTVDKQTGEIILNEMQNHLNMNDLKDATFVGDNGEQGTFMVIDQKYYLVFLEQRDSCDLGTAVLQHLDGTPLTTEEYDRIHRFLRLWRKLDWTIDETDQAVAALSLDQTMQSTIEESMCDQCGEEDCGCYDDCLDGGGCEDYPVNKQADINPFLIHQLVAVKKLLDLTGLELIKLLTFWSNISTAGEKSLYCKLFLTHNVLGIDKIFKADDHGNFLTANAALREHLPVVMAALNLSADDIQAIMRDTKMEDKLTLSHLSVLYRYRLLSKALSLKIPAFIRILPLFGEVFRHAQSSLDFFQRWDRMESAGFSAQQLNYIINGVDDDKKPYSPTMKDVLLLSKSLYDGLNAIDEAHKDVQADITIQDPSAQEVNIQEQATSELVRSKANLLFDSETTNKILGLLEGTNVFTTNAPIQLSLTLPEIHSLKSKLKYDPTVGSIQITGILTPSEIDDYKALAKKKEWEDALTRIQKQQAKQWKVLLSGIFENVQTKNPNDKKRIEDVMKSGDVLIPLDKIQKGEVNPNTAALKRVAFLELFLPYLRQQLTHRFVIDTLAKQIGLDTKVTDVLVTEIVRDSSDKPLYDIFEKIKESAKPNDANWNGYLIPASDASYTFIVKNSNDAPTVIVDGKQLHFTASEDPTNEWWSGALTLQAGKIVKLAATGIKLSDLCWKTPSSAITSIPLSSLIPNYASEPCESAMISLQRAAMLVSVLNINEDEIRFIHQHNVDFEQMNVNALTLDTWLRLEAYVRLRNSLPQAKLSLLDFLKWTSDADSDSNQLVDKIVDLTTWKKEHIQKIIASNHYGLQRLEDFRNEINLLKLQKTLSVADKIGVDIDRLFDWAVPTSKFNTTRKIADNMKNAIRAKYNQTDWEQIVKPLNDRHRNDQKQALIAYLLQQKELIAWNVTDADGLFEYFLIDVQMEPCMETSRIKQAISSVQLFIQRCFLGLEIEHSRIMPDLLDRKRWEWMQPLPVFEANKKVNLYPENWIEGVLRDDKSEIFKELESDLLQKDISKQNVMDALKTYLYKMDEIANMEVVGLYLEKGSKLHIFSRTRNAPYFFYYRYFAIDEMNWYPWQKMQVDITSYDIEDLTTKVVIGNGCYLTPVAWNERLLVFFPQIVKKMKANQVATAGSFNDIGSANVDAATPTPYYQIKMAWSEYRNGKWTQKQISNNMVTLDVGFNRRIDQFSFIPEISDSSITIHIDDQQVNSTSLCKGFTFTGSMFEDDKHAIDSVNALPTSVESEFGPSTVFHRMSNQIKSYQLAEGAWGNDGAYFSVNSNNVTVTYPNLNIWSTNFYQPEMPELLKLINLGQLEDFFEYHFSLTSEALGQYNPDPNNAKSKTFHELKSPVSLPTWELFFHVPLLISDAYFKANLLEEAMKMIHVVFNPFAKGTEDNRFWQFRPFREINSQSILDSIFNHLEPNAANQTISEWRNKPFMPHAIARSRPVAYMKWVVMKYVEIIFALADEHYRKNTIESYNRATQFYVLIGHILGPKPMMIPKRGKTKPQTYLSLLDKWDAYGNAMVELELTAPFSNQTNAPVGKVNNEIVFPNIYGLASTLYFCIPNNPKLLGYWDMLEDRLYKIRHCQDIDGVTRKLSLFEPSIDPALLVKAAAQGISIESVLNDLNAPMPNYRFYYLLQKAFELCNELKSLDSLKFSTKEKLDNESISFIRAKHESIMNNLIMDIKKQQAEEAQKNLESLMQNRKGPESDMKYYLKLSGLEDSWLPNETTDFKEIPNDIATVDGDSGLKLIAFEKEEMDNAGRARELQSYIGKAETLSSILHIIPSFESKAEPFGIGMGSTITSGWMLGNAAQAVASAMKLFADDFSYQSTNAGRKANLKRALQDRIKLANAAGFNIKQIDKQIIAQQIRLEIANKEIENQQKAIDNAREVEEFIKNKYSNEVIYLRMCGSLEVLKKQVYDLVRDLGLKAQMTYCFEKGISNANYIQSGFDTGIDGLFAGEKLYVGLKQLEAAYQNERGHDYEITKQISLYQINPLAIIQLRETGICEFALPEALFDMDYPGHYKRRIKTISLSIPCIAGPYTGINATLSLLENKFRNTAIGGKTYEENAEETDPRFSSYHIPINAIAASTAQNDSGMFELNFKDERYLPFEGAGVISRWRLELPKFRQIDYSKIADAIMHVKYTSCEGGERLKAAATTTLSKRLESMEQELGETGLHIALSMQRDMPNEWHLLKRSGAVDLTITKSMLPLALMMSTEIEHVMFMGKVKDNPISFAIAIDGNQTSLNRIDDLKRCSGHNEDILLDHSFTLSIDSDDLKKLEEFMLVVKYRLR